MEKLWNRTAAPASAKIFNTPEDEFEDDGSSPPMNDRAVSAHERREALVDKEFDSRAIARRIVKYVDMVQTPTGICRRFYTSSEQNPRDPETSAHIGSFSSSSSSLIQIMICWLPANSKKAAAPLPNEGEILTVFLPGAAIMNDGGAVVVNEKSVSRFRVVRVLDTKMSRSVYTMNKIAIIPV